MIHCNSNDNCFDDLIDNRQRNKIPVFLCHADDIATFLSKHLCTIKGCCTKTASSLPLLWGFLEALEDNPSSGKEKLPLVIQRFFIFTFSDLGAN